ncbi:MAG: hypothetical protein JWN67_5043 [Actinomycetia bacterium]|nr:hypothetical protein [Actinomycetes bacterium]
MEPSGGAAGYRPSNTSQKWCVFIGICIAAVGFLLLVVPARARVGLVATEDCGSTLDKLSGTAAPYDECNSKLNERLTLGSIALIGGVFVAVGGRMYFAESTPPSSPS